MSSLLLALAKQNLICDLTLPTDHANQAFGEYVVKQTFNDSVAAKLPGVCKVSFYSSWARSVCLDGKPAYNSP